MDPQWNFFYRYEIMITVRDGERPETCAKFSAPKKLKGI